MLVRLEPREWLVIGRSILALFACIVAGSIIVEIQLNQLTYWQDFVKVFNLMRVTEGAYLAYVLGTEHYIKASWQVGTIAATSKSLDVTLMGVGLNLPTQVSFDASPTFDFAQTTWKQAIEYAYIGKRYLSEYWEDYRPYFRIFLQHVADLVK